MKLIVVHYHFRPGGIRRIIEMGLPFLLAAKRAEMLSQGAVEIVLAGGEAPDSDWVGELTRRCQGARLSCFVEPAFGYVSEWNGSVASLRSAVARGLKKILHEANSANSANALVWAHNLGVGRNLLLARALIRECVAREVPLVAHHHDWWFDNRWLRWPEIRRCGFPSLRSVTESLFPSAPQIRHVAINQSDARILRRNLGARVAWMPNLTEPAPEPKRERVAAVRGWLRGQLSRADAPVWIVPCRVLRRKNLAEAILLVRWLRPEAWMVTTGGPSSAEERPYADALSRSAKLHGWRLRIGVLQGNESGKPSVHELLGASEAVLLTSIQEGFGLPYLEAACVGRPLIARQLPNVAPDLKKFGFHFPHEYTDILVDPRLFDWAAEARRQEELFGNWLKLLPASKRSWVSQPVLLANASRPVAVPFSKLTLAAQLEVLSQPAKWSWELCAPLNPFLVAWRAQAQQGALQTTSWPPGAGEWLSGPAYANRFWKIVRARLRTELPSGTAVSLQENFMRERLAPAYVYPLLWNGSGAQRG